MSNVNVLSVKEPYSGVDFFKKVHLKKGFMHQNDHHLKKQQSETLPVKLQVITKTLHSKHDNFSAWFPAVGFCDITKALH